MSKKKKKDKEEKHRQARKTSASKPTTPLNALRGAIGFRKEWSPLRKALDRAKEDASPKLYPDLLQLASISPMVRFAFPASKPAQKIESVQSVIRLEPVSFYKEVAWVLTALQNASNVLRAFIPLRDEYIAQVMQGEFGLAFLTLNKIDKVCGPSFWAVETRIALMTRAGGFDNQKSYVKAITANHPRSYLAFFAANVGERNEARVTLGGFESRLRDRMSGWSLREPERDYLYYKLLGRMDDSFPKAASLLSSEASSSTIDLYESAITILCAVLTNPSLRRGDVLPMLSKLDGLEDHCVRNLKIAYGADCTSSVECSEQPTYLEHFLRGDYERAAKHAARALSGLEQSHSAIGVASRLRALTVAVDVGSRSFAGDLLTLLEKFNSHTENTDPIAEEIEKHCLNFRHVPVASSLAADVQRANPRAPLSLTVETAVRQKKLTVDALNKLRQPWPKQESSRRWEQCSALATETCAYFQVAQALHDGAAPDEAGLQRLENSSHPFLAREAAVFRAWDWFRRGYILEALEKSVNCIVRWPGTARELPLVEIISLRGFRELKQLKDNLVLPIAFQMYIVATGDRSKEVSLKVAWKQFLQHHLVSLPSELKPLASQLGLTQPELNYFLKHVCIQDVMELGKAFSKPSDLDEERLRICLWLAELATEHADVDAEILELTRRLSIEEGVRRVESTRIYVDFFGLEKWAQVTLRESFLRYLDYVSAGLAASVAELEKKLLEMLKRGGKVPDVITFLDDIDLSADTILADLIDRAAVAFMTLPRYGLDAFLGSRVRHGSLEGAFRSPLEHRRLVTKIGSRTGEYEANTFWADLCDDQQRKGKVDSVLRKFSRSVDSLIDNAVNRYVYVLTETNKDGLITLWQSEQVKRQLLQAWVIDVKIHLTPTATITDLLSHCVVNFFWPALNQSLQVIRSFVTDQLSGGILTLLQALDIEVKGIVGAERCGGFSNHVKAACSDVEAAAVKVSQWFVTPQQSEIQLIFTMKSALEIGMQSTQRIHANFEPVVQWEVEDGANVPLSARAFEVVNIAFLIFGNVARHSGYPQRGLSSDPRPGIDIAIRLGESNETIEFLVESDIGPDADEAQIRANVEAAKASIAERKYDEVARRRRGTGLVRLASTLNYEGADDRILDFGVTDALRFYVSISAPKYYFVVDPNSTSRM
jgi:hypothetical protein